MNYGIIVSYVIAGFLMLTILSVSYNVGFSNQEVTTTNIKQTHAQAITEIITSDIPKIGYSQKTVLDDPFYTATEHEISFQSDLNNDGTPQTVTWKYYPDITPEHAQNPNKRLLVRTVDGDDTEITAGVTNFKIKYYDTYGNTTPMPVPVSSSNFDDIVQIEIQIELQSEYELNYRSSQSGNYISSVWKKRFSPVNLRSN